TDTAVPNAPTVAMVKASSTLKGEPNNYIIGVDPPGSPSGYDTVESFEVQITTDATFATTVPANVGWQRVIGGKLGNIVPFTTTIPGTYYVRARAINIFGAGAWGSTSFTTNQN